MGPWQLVYCWTHVRRRFVKHFENEGSPIAEEMLRQIAALYGIEKIVRGREAAIRLAARRDHSAPIIAALKPWLVQAPTAPAASSPAIAMATVSGFNRTLRPRSAARSRSSPVIASLS